LKHFIFYKALFAYMLDKSLRGALLAV